MRWGETSVVECAPGQGSYVPLYRAARAASPTACLRQNASRVGDGRLPTRVPNAACWWWKTNAVNRKLARPAAGERALRSAVATDGFELCPSWTASPSTWS
jgi:hypothetical protein